MHEFIEGVSELELTKHRRIIAHWRARAPTQLQVTGRTNTRHLDTMIAPTRTHTRKRAPAIDNRVHAGYGQAKGALIN
jgi:hypothetical protein